MPLSLYSKKLYTTAFAAALLAGPAVSFMRACSICGCSLSSDWGLQNDNSLQGTELDGRFEFIEQNELRSGSHAVDRSSLEFPNESEIQQKTLNRGYWLGVDQVFDQHWALNAELPSYSRFHTTIAPGDTEISTSRANGFGDLQLVGRYQRHSPQQGWSLQLGFKLPTGKTDQTFAEGPQFGQPLDRGLQLGTGSTDVIAGASYFRRLANVWSIFAQIRAETPFTDKDDYRPSTSLGANLGIRYLNTTRWTPQLQVNAHWDGREHGVNADFDNSGDIIVDVSPGVTYDITTRSNAFVFVQLPLFERVNGLQIEPRWELSMGFRWRL